MMRLLRNQSQTVLVVVLGVLALGFVFYGSAGNLISSLNGSHTNNDFGRIDGEDLTVAQLYDTMRSTHDKFTLSGQLDRVSAAEASKAIAEEAWRQLLIQHEADKLHITISDEEVVDHIKNIPIFQKNGAFDRETYKNQMMIMQYRLRIPTDGEVDAARATQAAFERIIREELRSDATVKALFDNVRASSGEISEMYQKYYAPVTVSYVTIDPKTLESTVQVTPGDIEAEYKEHPTNPDYRTAEKRKVDYVLFLLTPAQQKLPADQKAKAKDALGQQALDFALTFQPEPSASGSTPSVPDFTAEAKKRGLTPATSDFFAADSPAAGLPPSPSFNSAVFQLTKDNAISKVVEMDNGMAIIHLNEIQPSELRPLAEVQAPIKKQLQETKSMTAAEAKASEVSNELKAAVAKGADIKAAAAALKLTMTTTPPFVPIKAAQSDPMLQAVAYASISLKPGEVSAPIPQSGSYLVAHLDNRAQASSSDSADLDRLREQRDDQLRQVAYADWAAWKSKQPGTHPPPDLDAYGAAE